MIHNATSQLALDAAQELEQSNLDGNVFLLTEVTVPVRCQEQMFRQCRYASDSTGSPLHMPELSEGQNYGIQIPVNDTIDNECSKCPDNRMFLIFRPTNIASTHYVTVHLCLC